MNEIPDTSAEPEAPAEPAQPQPAATDTALDIHSSTHDQEASHG